MPFKLFQTPKHLKKETSDKTSAGEMFERKSEEPPDNGLKKPNKNRLPFFSSSCSKNVNHVHFQDDGADKEKKVKSNGSFMQYKKTKSLIHIPFATKESASSTDHIGSDHCNPADRRHSNPQNKPRSASYGTITDNFSRERRLLEIAQLDNYMEYLRHTEDEGNMTNRLCCAQVLKMGLLRLEQRHLNSQERIDNCHKASANGNQSPINGYSNRFQKRKQLKYKGSDDDQSSAHSGDKDDNGPTHVTFICGQDSDGRESEHDSNSELDSEDSCPAQDIVTKPTRGVKNGRTPVWPRDIEIF